MPGVLIVRGMRLRIPRLTLSIGPDGVMTGPETLVPELRLDLWPTWLEIGCRHAAQATEWASALTPELDDEARSEHLGRELQDAMVALCAFAFAFDGFYDVVKSELGPHPSTEHWRRPGRRPTPRHVQIAETLRFHLKLGPKYTKQLRQLLRELLRFRGRAVHPSSTYIRAMTREDIDTGVHPHMITFSGRHAVQCREVTLRILWQLTQRAVEVGKPEAERGWLDTAERELTRLALEYGVTLDAVTPQAADDETP